MIERKERGFASLGVLLAGAGANKNSLVYKMSRDFPKHAKLVWKESARQSERAQPGLCLEMADSFLGEWLEKHGAKKNKEGRYTLAGTKIDIRKIKPPHSSYFRSCSRVTVREEPGA